MNLKTIFKNIDELNQKIYEENVKLNLEVEKLWDKEADLIQMENSIIFNSEDYKGLKNDKQRNAYIKEETLSENHEIFKTKQKINNIKNNIDLLKNKLKMFNRMVDNKFYEVE